MAPTEPRTGTNHMDGSDNTFRLTDWLFWIYNAIVVILLLLMGNHVEGRWVYLGANFGLIILSVLLIHLRHRFPGSPVFSILRNWYPLLYFFFLHWESGMIGDILFQGSFDSLVAAWDYALFGDYLHNILYRYQPIWFSEFIHFTYFFYYLLLIAPALLLYRDDREKFASYVFDVSLFYLIQYTIFYMFPVIGPIEHHYAKFPDGVLFIPLMKILYVLGDSPGGAVPSSHVSVALLSWYWLYKIKPRLALPSLFLVACLVFSTVYLSFHYAIDAVAGLIFGVLLIRFLDYLRSRYGEYALR
ncbi:MAG: phosphatase PAP2 family protein [Candidatus Marinimicrobia bacterium]|nr:phosphatase PAP2 family protein [Candidatus Neomarinimicrobiota bacterium]MCF7827899.1 phosphatase PAP2 family protein [Candidatus Neomarinimicrobiota bacterium]MCF7879346.1 phosphatase PAP2 family protein [Candidatus Neomarinimicrobiota bacterium]